MSVEVLTAIVGAAFLLVLLLKVLRDKCVKKDHEESEYYVMVGSCSTGFDGMCFFPFIRFSQLLQLRNASCRCLSGSSFPTPHLLLSQVLPVAFSLTTWRS